MVITYLRFLSGRERSREADRHLGLTLAFVAGAVNAGGYLAVAQYTSHMTGILSSIADNLALSRLHVAASGAAAFVSFVCGAATSAVLINWARRKNLRSEYALPLMLEAVLLLVFGLLGANLKVYVEVFVPVTVLLLCYMMGLQNAIITKASNAIIRTTHMTGNSTDLGIELGKLFYWNMDGTASDRVLANREKLGIHASLIALFVTGGIVGALGFKRIGYISTLPLAVLLFIIAIVPVWDDLVAPRAG
ncbi:MAG: DUF1275 domain-containing protein [Elusimicrobia bacterium]|nr:DUF1275 domain-containing protein [Elusimicrobiota bacterium]